MRHLFINKLYFDFFQTFENSKVWKKLNYNSFIFYVICIYTYIYNFKTFYGKCQGIYITKKTFIINVFLVMYTYIYIYIYIYIYHNSNGRVLKY